MVRFFPLSNSSAVVLLRPFGVAAIIEPGDALTGRSKFIFFIRTVCYKLSSFSLFIRGHADPVSPGSLMGENRISA